MYKNVYCVSFIEKDGNECKVFQNTYKSVKEAALFLMKNGFAKVNNSKYIREEDSVCAKIHLLGVNFK